MKIGDTVKIVEESAMSIFGYNVGDIFVINDIDKDGKINIDSNRPNEYWKTWRFKIESET